MRHELFEPVWTEHGFGTRLQDFQKLMHHRIRDVLLVSSLFDLYAIPHLAAVLFVSLA